jgi:hypothetical protein
MNFVYVMIGIPTLILVMGIAAAWSSVLLFVYVKQRMIRLLLLSAVLPFVFSTVVVNPYAFVRTCHAIGDVLHFTVGRLYYDREIAALPANIKPRVAVFNWGGMIWFSDGLVYDESDQILLPPGHQSKAWQAVANNTELSCGYGVQPLWDHYYLANFPC